MLRPVNSSGWLSGQAMFGSHDDKQAKRALGYLPEGAPSYGELTVREFLHFIQCMRGMDTEAGYRRFAEVVQQPG